MALGLFPSSLAPSKIKFRSSQVTEGPLALDDALADLERERTVLFPVHIL